MRIRLFYVVVLALFSCKFLNSEDFNLKKIEDIKKLIGIIKSTEQMPKISNKVEVLSFVLKSINFREATPCIKKAFFSVLSVINNSLMSVDSNDLLKLDSFLQSLSRGDIVTDSYKKQINTTRAAINWILGGRVGVVPDFIKEQIIKSYQKNYACDIFIAVGDCHADMLVAQRKIFKRLFAIGFEDKLSKSKNDKLKRYSNIYQTTCLDEKALTSVIKRLNSNAIFWLSAKKSKKFMISIKSILKHRNKNVILIENANLFEESELKDLTNFIKSRKSHAIIDVNDDMIRMVF